MKTSLRSRFTCPAIGFVLLATLLSSSSSRAAGADSFPDAHLQAIESACTLCSAAGSERRVLAGDVAEYTLPVQVGPGEHDRVLLHRVVRERAPWVPRSAPRGVFFVHGDLLGFDGAFLAAAGVPAVDDAHALPVFLAQRGLDVWGISLRWTQVPAATTDLSIMTDWDLETDATDVRIGLAAARLARTLTGSGASRLALLGWSRGGQIGYAVLDAESQLAPAQRHVKAFVPVDIYLKTDDPVLRARACARYELLAARIAGGEIADTSGQLIAALGTLAELAPGAASPILPGLTNRQAGLLPGQATFNFFPPGLEPVPVYHFTGGLFDQNGLPTGLLYSNEALLFSAFETASPFQPTRELADGDAAICDGPSVPDVPWDDHFEDVSVPVLYVGAGGGFGAFGIYTASLLGSTDVSAHIVSLTPPAARLFDIGHADIFIADDAPALFWQPVLDWLRAH